MTQILAWLGGIALLILVASELWKRLAGRVQVWKRKKAIGKAEKLDWKLIDNVMNSDRLRPDCERQESLGICTGRDCLVYDSCNFNIKKVVH